MFNFSLVCFNTDAFDKNEISVLLTQSITSLYYQQYGYISISYPQIFKYLWPLNINFFIGCYNEKYFYKYFAYEIKLFIS